MLDLPLITQGLDRRPKKDWPKPKKALAEGQSPPQQLEVSQRSGLYLLVRNIVVVRSKIAFLLFNVSSMFKVLQHTLLFINKNKVAQCVLNSITVQQQTASKSNLADS